MSVRIGIGIASFPFASARELWRWVELCEQSAIDSLWQTDRLVSEQPFLETLQLMGALAGATERLKFGMNAVVVAFRDPLLLAKQCATVDYLSGGRLLPVFGVGRDHAPEWRAGYGPPGQRGRRADEALTLMRRLWTEEHVSFEGEFYRYQDVTISPRPVQSPLPCWIGGSSAAAIRRTAALGTGWLGGVETPDVVRTTLEGIRKQLAVTGRRIDPDHYGASVAYRFGSWDDPEVQSYARARSARIGPSASPRDTLCVGDATTIVTRLREYHAAGASKFVLIPAARGADELMDQTRRLAAEVVPAVHSW